MKSKIVQIVYTAIPVRLVLQKPFVLKHHQLANVNMPKIARTSPVPKLSHFYLQMTWMTEKLNKHLVTQVLWRHPRSPVTE